VEYTDKSIGYRTLAHLRKVNFDDKDLFIDYIIERLGVLTDSYTVLPISRINFSYIIREGLVTTSDKASLLNIEDKTLCWHRFNNMNLPITMIPSEYGTILTREEMLLFTRYLVKNLLFRWRSYFKKTSFIS
jgi:hypothetical protein